MAGAKVRRLNTFFKLFPMAISIKIGQAPYSTG